MALQRFVFAEAHHLFSCRNFATANLQKIRKVRTLFHELRDPPPVSLTINQRADWPLTDLKHIALHSVSTMDSLQLTRHAERLCRRARGQSPEGNWEAILIRFSELVSEMDADLSIRLLRCLARANIQAALEPVVRGLPISTSKSPSNLSCWSSALLDLKDPLGKEELQRLFQILQETIPKFTEEAWGLSAPMMLVSLVRASDLGSEISWSPSCCLLVGAIARHASRMGPRHLEISAFSCARLSKIYRKEAEAAEKLTEVASMLLQHGTRRASSFVPRGLLNFFIALERLLGPLEVVDLAGLLVERLQHCQPGDLDTCSPGDHYRAVLCLLRAGQASTTEGATVLASEEMQKALEVLMEKRCVDSWSLHARQALLKRLHRIFGDEDLEHLRDLVSLDAEKSHGGWGK